MLAAPASKAKKGPEDQNPSRVPGTGTDDVANNSIVENCWILKEMPLYEEALASSDR